MRAEPTIPHQPPPTLAEQKQRIPAWLSKQLSVAFGRMTIDEGDLWSVFGSYLSVIFPVERGFMIGSPLSLPPVAGKSCRFSSNLKSPLNRIRYASRCPGRRHLQGLAFRRPPLRR